MTGGLNTYQSHSAYLDVNLSETKENNQCGKTYVVDAGSRKITIVQGVSQREFSAHFADTINRGMKSMPSMVNVQ
jgi:hypothetical protein